MRHLFSFATRSLVIVPRVKAVLVIAALTGSLILQSSYFAVAQAPVETANVPVAVAPAASPAVQQDAQRAIAVILVKNALLAVNQGNLTGNYTVLRDLASPGFRDKNSAADLAAIFQNIRQQKVDLSPIVSLEPVMSQPRIMADGQIALEGYFEAQQMRINFQLVFLKAATNGWMIHGVTLNAVPLSTTAAATARQ